MSKTYVLDANAILDFLMNGPGAERVEYLLRGARPDTPLLVSAVNWGEVFYISWQRHGAESAKQTLAELLQFSIRIVPVDVAQVLKAGELKAVHKVPYVDCLAAALATLNQATLVTSDRDFEKLGRQFPILWITRP
ncbi:MAG: type II toxin-antitoxin system VapC family toxin [Terriglobales bacterium]|jgi:predicted nucleic acid-binding protein